jgi:penicillin-binding protein 1C
MTTPPNPKSRRRRLRTVVVRALLAAAFPPVLAVLAWHVALRLIPPLPPPAFPRPATFLFDRDRAPLAAFVGQEDAWYIPLASADLSPHLLKAIVAVEDRRFYAHHGVDWYSAVGAAWEDLAALHIRRGASTIPMQVVRLRDPGPRSFAAKARQAFRAAQLELTTSKADLLAEYLNRAPFGGNLVGAGAASWRYFGKACRDLSLGQAALLAGLPQNPNRLRPDRFPDLARARRTLVLRRMLDLRLISSAEFDRAAAEPVAAGWNPLAQRSAAAAPGALPALAALAQSHLGEHVTTTLDPGIQATAFAAARDHLRSLSASGIDSAAVVILDVPTGDILATVSLSDSAPAVDLARTPRSTGSTLKPFIYAAAFDEGILTPASTLLDSPKAWAGYLPANFDRAFRGPIPAAEALADSRNIPAMTVLARAGIERTLQVIDAAGIHAPLRSARRYGLSLAIGGAEASPLELAEGYATLARGGVRLPSALYSSPGHSLPRPDPVLPAAVAYATLHCLDDPDRTRSVPGGAPAAALAAAWKTGTSNGLRDAWCAAATPRRAVVVWLGNSDGRGASALVGQEAAAPLALKLLAAADPGGPPFPPSPAAPGPALPTRRSDPLSIVTPANNAEYFLDGPATRVPLSCAGGTGERRWWFANGEFIGTQETAAPLLWSAAAGAWDLKVTSAAGEASHVHIVVR